MKVLAQELAFITQIECHHHIWPYMMVKWAVLPDSTRQVLCFDYILTDFLILAIDDIDFVECN